MSPVPSVRLNDGRTMPALGFGVWQISDESAENAVLDAIVTGYRSIDTAHIYRNEQGVGRALAKTDVPRSELFVTTKVWNAHQGRDAARRAFDESLAKLGVEYVDLYLIHWPAPSKGLYIETWQTLCELQKEGRAKSIGVSNFGPVELTKIIEATGTTPAVNQIELHPRFQQHELRAFHEAHHIVTEAWSPLGQGKLLTDAKITDIAHKHERSPAQILLRWHLQRGFVAIPKSEKAARIRENFAILDFALDDADLAVLDALDSPGGRIGPNPHTATF